MCNGYICPHIAIIFEHTTQNFHLFHVSLNIWIYKNMPGNGLPCPQHKHETLFMLLFKIEAFFSFWQNVQDYLVPKALCSYPMIIKGAHK